MIGLAPGGCPARDRRIRSAGPGPGGRDGATVTRPGGLRPRAAQSARAPRALAPAAADSHRTRQF
eukprot:667611-Hanusia_phi.AAC.1